MTLAEMNRRYHELKGWTFREVSGTECAFPPGRTYPESLPRLDFNANLLIPELDLAFGKLWTCYRSPLCWRIGAEGEPPQRGETFCAAGLAALVAKMEAKHG